MQVTLNRPKEEAFFKKLSFEKQSARSQKKLREIHTVLRNSTDEALQEIHQVCKIFKFKVSEKRMNSLLSEEIEVTEDGYLLRIDYLEGKGTIPEKDLNDSIYIEIERTPSGFKSYVVFDLDKNKKYILGKPKSGDIKSIRSSAKKTMKFFDQLSRA